VTLAAGIDNYLLKKKSFGEMFSILRESAGKSQSAELEEADQIHLFWTPGIVKLANWQKKRSDQKLIIHMHDMYFATGGCHQTLGCKSIKDECRNCPNVNNLPKIRNLVHKNRRIKDNLLDQADLIVTPTKWLANSVLDRNHGVNLEKKIFILENPIKNAYIQPQDPSSKAKAFLIVATDLASPNKNVRSVVEALARRFDQTEEIWLVGANGSRFSNISSKVKVLGALSVNELQAAYQKAWFVVSGTQHEAFGLTIAEAASQGLPALVKSGSGSQEFIDKYQSGVIFSDFSDLSSIALPQIGSNSYLKFSQNGYIGVLNHEPTHVAKKLLQRLEYL